jgi:transposase
MTDVIGAYLLQLRAQAEAQNNHQTTRGNKRVKPLDQQITELMNTLPAQLRNRPWSMAELVQRLTGKYRARPHPQQVGDALRRLGWKRERRWGKGFDGVRVWVPR